MSHEDEDGDGPLGALLLPGEVVRSVLRSVLEDANPDVVFQVVVELLVGMLLIIMSSRLVVLGPLGPVVLLGAVMSLADPEIPTKSLLDTLP